MLIDEIDLPAARELWARLWPLCIAPGTDLRVLANHLATSRARR